MKRTLLFAGALVAILVSTLAAPKAQADLAFSLSFGTARHSGFSHPYAPTYRNDGYMAGRRERERSWMEQRRNWNDGDGNRANVGRDDRRDSGRFQDNEQGRTRDRWNERGFHGDRGYQVHDGWGWGR
jgi:hypothetical protein